MQENARRWSLGRFMLVTFLLVPAGCVTLARGRTETVTIHCPSQGAQLSVDGKPADFGQIELSRAQEHELHVGAPGMQSRDLRITRRVNSVAFGAELVETVLLLIPAVAVDLGNGAEQDLVPKKLSVELEPNAYVVVDEPGFWPIPWALIQPATPR